VSDHVNGPDGSAPEPAVPYLPMPDAAVGGPALTAPADPAPALSAPVAPSAPVLSETPVTPRPSSPPSAQASGAGRVAGIAIAIAIAGVLLSVVAGGAAGTLGARLASFGTGAVVTSSASIDASAEPVAAAAARALPSVVNIDVTDNATATGLPLGHPVVPSGATGSGVAFKAAPGGGTYILTNDHVVSGATKIVVTPPNGAPIVATLVGTDPGTDIAVVKVAIGIPVITVADSDVLVVGQIVVAIGSPFGLQHSVSSGVVSAVHRSITGSTDTTGSNYPLVDAIQTDAAINPGNSGGALVDRLGRLVGIDSAIYTDSGSSAGVGFAIPSNTAIRVATELIATGKVEHPFLGIEGRTVTDADAKTLGMTTAVGAIVESVVPNTGAARAGLRANDVVTAVDGQPLRTMDDLLLAVRRTQVGEKVTLTVWRDKASISIVMTVGNKPAAAN
jgi:putative serine protease PepD